MREKLVHKIIRKLRFFFLRRKYLEQVVPGTLYITGRTGDVDHAHFHAEAADGVWDMVCPESSPADRKVLVIASIYRPLEYEQADIVSVVFYPFGIGRKQYAYDATGCSWCERLRIPKY